MEDEWGTDEESKLAAENKIFKASMLEGEAPEREWIVDGYVPKGTVTGIFGMGGVGKSLLTQQLGVAVSTGTHWLGRMVKKAPVLGYFCEDEKDELWRRQNAILKMNSLATSEVEEFYMQSRRGMENILMKFDHGIGAKTDFFHEIMDTIRNFNVGIVMLDNSAQLFGGNENDRREVTQFVNALYQFTMEGDVSVILLGHPPKPTQNGQAEYSGSTAWDACFRSRLTFKRADNKEEDDDLKEVRILAKSKANYSTMGDQITVKWERGAFIVHAAQKDMVDAIEISARQKEAKEAFLAMLNILMDQTQETSASKQSPNYAPKIMMRMDMARDKRLTSKLIEAAMTLLFNEKKIGYNQPLFKRGRMIYGIGVL